MSSPDGQFISVAEAISISGVSDGLIRRYLRDGRLAGFKANERAWLVSREAALALRSQAGPLSTVRKAEAAERAEKESKARRKRKTR